MCSVVSVGEVKAPEPLSSYPMTARSAGADRPAAHARQEAQRYIVIEGGDGRHLAREGDECATEASRLRCVGGDCDRDQRRQAETCQTATLDTAGTVLALTLINKEHAAPGTQVTVTWGEHPGAGTAPDADLGFPKLRATVAPAPYDAYAATQYRRH